MNCLIDFLTDNTQKSLINMVQNRDETFERELESYRKLFMVEKNYCMGRIDRSDKDSTEGENSIYCHNEDCCCRDSCCKIKEIIQDIDDEKIKKFFEGIQCCYRYWIDSKTTLALEAFDTLLKEYGIINQDGGTDDELLLKDAENRVFYRARLTEQFLSKKEMFHVPFNKRYNIRNERFSLTGQPLLYLGNSIADVVEELGVNINDEESLSKLRVSSFEFQSNCDKKKIFDLRCNIQQDLKNVDRPTFSEKKFFRNILSEICSFQKRKELEEYAFKEEYVIPQMLAQVLKQNSYDGVCYYSTKRFHGYEMQGVGKEIINCDKNLQYRENVALFTHMSEDDDENEGDDQFYDEYLYESMEISMPIAARNVKDCYESELERLKNIINNHYKDICVREEKWQAEEKDSCENNEKKMTEPNKRLMTAKGCNRKAISIVAFYQKVFSKIYIDGRRYSDTQLGQLHIQLLIGILNRLLVESELNGETNQKKQSKINVDVNHENRILYECDMLGSQTYQSSSREVHEKGKLHKSRVAFLYKMESNAILIAVLKLKNWVEMIYAHDVPGDEEYNRKVEKYMKTAASVPEVIGSFIIKEVSVAEKPEGGFGIKKNFEYVSTEIIQWTDQNEEKTEEKTEEKIELEWKKGDELQKIYTNHFDKMSTVYRQAIPILIKKIAAIEESLKQNQETN